MPFRTADFESAASTDFATLADCATMCCADVDEREDLKHEGATAATMKRGR
jgi:hypothetical protein